MHQAEKHFGDYCYIACGCKCLGGTFGDTPVKISLKYTGTQTYSLMSHDDYKTFSICYIKYNL